MTTKSLSVEIDQGLDVDTANEIPPQSRKLPILLPIGTSSLSLSAGIRIRYRDISKVLILIITIFVLFTTIITLRIWKVEQKNALLETQILNLESKMNVIISMIPGSINGELIGEDSTPSQKGRIRRDISIPGQNQEYPTTGPISVDKNDTNSSLIVGPSNEAKSRVIRKGRVREPGKHTLTVETTSADRSRNSIKVLKLKLKLANAKRRAVTAKLKNFTTSTSTNSAFLESRAAYLMLSFPHVDITNPGQIIGPWHFGDGHEIGFDEFWYDDLSLDEYQTSVIIPENGLHLISAQIYYHLRSPTGQLSNPMGYRIYIRKHNSSAQGIFKRPLSIAECVPSFPSTTYQTCYTQAVWYMEKGDSVFLQHFPNSLPVIQADNQGKTFLGILRFPSISRH